LQSLLPWLKYKEPDLPICVGHTALCSVEGCVAAALPLQNSWCIAHEDQLAPEQQAQRFLEASRSLHGRFTELFCTPFLAADFAVGRSVFLCCMVMEML